MQFYEKGNFMKYYLLENFISAVKKMFEYHEFDERKGYVYFVLTKYIILMLVSIFSYGLIFSDYYPNMIVGVFIFIIYFSVTKLAHIAYNVRRSRDAGFNPWIILWMELLIVLFMLISLRAAECITVIYIFVLMITPTDFLGQKRNTSTELIVTIEAENTEPES